jgi:hypothetical protein
MHPAEFSLGSSLNTDQGSSEMGEFIGIIEEGWKAASQSLNTDQGSSDK